MSLSGLTLLLIEVSNLASWDTANIGISTSGVGPAVLA